jgi:hypothetical protein
MPWDVRVRIAILPVSVGFFFTRVEPPAAGIARRVTMARRLLCSVGDAAAASHQGTRRDGAPTARP